MSKANKNKKLLMLVNDASFFLSHRLAVAEEARAAGFDVHIATMPGDDVRRVKDLGFVHHDIPLSRSGKNPIVEMKALFAIWVLLWRLKPTILHLVTIKPVLYGGLAAHFAPVRGIVAAISGLGFVFLSKGRGASLLRHVVLMLYKVALKHRNAFIVFQNPDDFNVFLQAGIVSAEKAELIRGSGVDLELYRYVPERGGEPIVCCASRLLQDKGVVEFVEAVRLLSQRGVKARFQLIGSIDQGNPSSISEIQLASWRNEGVIEFLGHRSDVNNLFASAHIIVLPSYREGLPKVLVEAGACGRAVVTTDVAGCRDAIVPNVTGLIVPVRDAGSLADAIQRLVDDSNLRRKMGEGGRKLAEREFAIQKIVQQHLNIYIRLAT